MAYASQTSVTVRSTQSQIRAILQRYGASGLGIMEEGHKAAIGFKLETPEGPRMVRIMLELPERDDPEFTTTATGRVRAGDAAFKAWEQACRSRWRALLLIIRAKLEAVDSGITTLEREFMPDVLLPSGETIGEVVERQRPILDGGGSLRLLPGGDE